MDEELDASEGARIFKALQDLNLPPLAPLYNIADRHRTVDLPHAGRRGLVDAASSFGGRHTKDHVRS